MIVAAPDIIGTLPAWILVIAAVAIAWSVRGGSADKSIAILRESNEVLLAEIKELEKKEKTHNAEIAALAAKTDVTLAIAPLIAWSERHEVRAQERHESSQENAAERNVAVLRVLEMIAERLGPEWNGHGSS